MIDKKVVIKQKNAPYNSFNKVGIIIDFESELFDGNDWYLVRFKEPNDKEPYESWFLKKHLRLIKDGADD